jgi:hypothetical protein
VLGDLARRGPHLHDLPPPLVRGRHGWSSRAAATPARTASRSWSRPPRRGALGPAARRRARARRSAWAPAIRCGWRPACRSTATTSTRPSRRSRPASPSPSPSAAARPAISRRGADRARAGRRPSPCASACGAGRRAGARGRRDRRRGRRSVGRWSPAAASRPLGAPIAMGFVPPALAEPGNAAAASWCAASPRPPRSSPCRSFPTAITASQEKRAVHAFHQGS